MSGEIIGCVFRPIKEDGYIVGVEIDVGEEGRLEGNNFSGFPNWQFWDRGMRLFVDDKGRPESDGFRFIAVNLDAEVD